MRLLKLQILPWWFHFLGNPKSCLQIQHQRLRKIKLIKSDGVVKMYDRPINVSELMMEFPKHLVCRSDSFYIGQKIPALSENEKLQLGHSYFILPNHCFQKVLSFVNIASFASRNDFIKKAATSTCQPFDIQRSPSGCARIHFSDEFISQLMMKGGNDAIGLNKLCTTPQLHKDYKQLVGLRRWNPKLETIQEKENKRLSSFVIGKYQKSTSSSNSKSSKFKIKSRK